MGEGEYDGRLKWERVVENRSSPRVRNLIGLELTGNLQAETKIDESIDTLIGCDSSENVPSICLVQIIYI